jgi:hypothetical protein
MVAAYLAFLPEAPGGLLNDVVGHFIVACILAVGVLLSIAPRFDRRVLLVLLAGGLVAGAAVEILQRELLAGRRAQLTDLAADVAGVVVGAGLVLFLRRVLGIRRATVVALGALSLLLAAAIVGPVGQSPPVRHWRLCTLRDDRAPPASVRTMDVFEPAADGQGALLDGEGRPVAVSRGPHRLSELDAADLIDSFRCAGTFSVSVTVTTADLEQEGPSRIVAIAGGTGLHQQDFHLGQESHDLTIRFRQGPGTMSQLVVEDVFTEVGRPVDLAVRHRNRELQVFVDGRPAAAFEIAERALDSWSHFPLSIGDEITDDRPFDGTITNLRLTAEWLPDDELT